MRPGSAGRARPPSLSLPRSSHRGRANHGWPRSVPPITRPPIAMVDRNAPTGAKQRPPGRCVTRVDHDRGGTAVSAVTARTTDTEGRRRTVTVDDAEMRWRRRTHSPTSSARAEDHGFAREPRMPQPEHHAVRLRRAPQVSDAAPASRPRRGSGGERHPLTQVGRRRCSRATASATKRPHASCVSTSMTTSGRMGLGLGSAMASGRLHPVRAEVAERATRRRVVGHVIDDGAAPGTRRPCRLPRSPPRLSTMVMRMAPFGQACTQAGASPAARRRGTCRTCGRCRGATLYRGTS